ncbi:MAG: hypothetical protein A3G41_07725 [Elusimicrobia bacterium RIFCSPLOWO2_12_FULL_59_9]|nr:MAG: hypothetical protein A3G41_07725 [Elusimicrobia bacterium RIFCSPLOWO2_12_FULL_59_9]
MFKLNNRGQLVVPSVIILPSLVLFIYLLFETFVISREKIRHQFAVDSASFVELTQYSDFLNRTAYVNGAFVWRVFQEAFGQEVVSGEGKSNQSLNVFDALYENGAFPKGEGSGGAELDEEQVWKIRYNDAIRPGINDEDPEPGVQNLTLFTSQQREAHWLVDENVYQYKNIFNQLFQLLYQVQSAQAAVNKKITEKHDFFTKSYHLNTTEPARNAWRASRAIPNLEDDTKMHFLEINTIFYTCRRDGTRNMPGDCNTDQYTYYYPTSYVLQYDDPEQLFQMTTVDNKLLSKFAKGISILQRWDVPDNYFGIKFVREMHHDAVVHSKIQIAGGQIWPDPTPKYQVRLYP